MKEMQFDKFKPNFQTLNDFICKSDEYKSCSTHQDLQSLYRLFFHLRKFEQNVVQISQVCDIVSESL